MKTFRLTALLLFLTSILFTCFSQKVEKGMIHFPTPGKSCQDILKLSGEWQFHPGNFLSAKEMLERKADEKQFMMVPSNWMDGSPDGKTMPAFGDATYFLQIVLDSASTDSPNSFGIRISDITSAYELYVNDKKVMGVGRVGKNGNAFEPGFCPQAGFFETEGDTINVIIHASNYFYPNFSGISRPILFGQEAPVIRKNLLLSDASFLLICIFGILFVFQLIIFIANPRETSNLIISLLALIFLLKYF
jgi:two-component system, sensor histidine kinase ChiS